MLTEWPACQLACKPADTGDDRFGPTGKWAGTLLGVGPVIYREWSRKILGNEPGCYWESSRVLPGNETDFSSQPLVRTGESGQ